MVGSKDEDGIVRRIYAIDKVYGIAERQIRGFIDIGRDIATERRYPIDIFCDDDLRSQ